MQPKIVHNNSLKEDKAKKKPGNKMTKLVEYLESVTEENFTGYIKVNFSQGSLGRVERFEEILKK